MIALSSTFCRHAVIVPTCLLCNTSTTDLLRLPACCLLIVAMCAAAGGRVANTYCKATETKARKSRVVLGMKKIIVAKSYPLATHRLTVMCTLMPIDAIFCIVHLQESLPRLSYPATKRLPNSHTMECRNDRLSDLFMYSNREMIVVDSPLLTRW